jgi:hypothetical protein
VAQEWRAEERCRQMVAGFHRDHPSWEIEGLDFPISPAIVHGFFYGCKNEKRNALLPWKKRPFFSHCSISD